MDTVEIDVKVQTAYVSKKTRLAQYLTSNEMLFYYSVLISSWDDRSWFFLVGIYLVALDPSNLVLVAVFGFLSSGIVLLFGSALGSWIDRTNRLSAVYVVLGVRNVSTLLCSICLCLVFFYYETVVTSGNHPTLILAAAVALVIGGVLAHAAGLANNNMLSRDWLAVYCAGDDVLLAKMSARFRLIDMVSKILSPVIIGQVMTYAGGRAVASIVFSVQVLCTLAVLTALLTVLYRHMPRLHHRGHTNVAEVVQSDKRPLLSDDASIDDEGVPEPRSSGTVVLMCLEQLVGGWRVYWRQRVLLAGVAMALLYMTVLGFDSVTTGYALSQGMTESVLSLLNAGAAVTGILGALVYPVAVARLGLVAAGVAGLGAQLVGLVPCVLSVWAPGSPFRLGGENTTVNTTLSLIETLESDNRWSWSLMLLMSGIVLSRLGLWMFDLTLSQLLVQTVPEIHRGKVNGVQNSVNMLFDMTKFALVLSQPLPRQFGLLVLLSVAAVAISALFYLTFALRHRCTVPSPIDHSTATEPPQSQL